MTAKCLLKLYIIGASSASEIALKNLHEIISRHRQNGTQLNVIDAGKHPQPAEDDRI